MKTCQSGFMRGSVAAPSRTNGTPPMKPSVCNMCEGAVIGQLSEHRQQATRISQNRKLHLSASLILPTNSTVFDSLKIRIIPDISTIIK